MDVATLWSEVQPAVEAAARGAAGLRGQSVAWGEVAQGRTWSRRSGERVVGVARWNVPRAHAWLSVTDDAPAQAVEGLVERRLRGAWSESPKLLYERIDLPWPLEDRHFVIESRTTTGLSARDPRVWERAWTLADSHLPQARTPDDAPAFDASARIGRNEGSWILIEAGPSATLAIYTVRVDLGGNLPESAVARWTAASVTDLFESMRKNATDAARRYAARCASRPLPGGDGAPLPCP